MPTLSEAERELLRLYIADPSDDNNEAIDDQTLDLIYEQTEGNLAAAAARAWRIKAGTVADWYLANIDGAFLSRDQVFEHCMKMAYMYDTAGGGALIVNVGLHGPNWVEEDLSSEF